MLHSHMNIISKLISKLKWQPLKLSNIYSFFYISGISDDRLDFLRKSYENEKKKILQTYEKDMTDYKDKKFQIQKELESVYYGLAEVS